MASPRASPVSAARHLADEILFPAAPGADRADRVPEANLAALAEAGLYGLVGSRRHGGLGVGSDPATVAGVVEALASGCLSTTLVWAQHHSLVKALMTRGAPARLRSEWLGPLCRGDCRAGVSLGGVLPGPPALRAAPAGEGWSLEGTSPWVSGWGMVDVMLVGARGPDDTVVWLLVDAAESTGLAARRHRLVALDSTVTVELSFTGLVVPRERVVGVQAWSAASYSGVDRLRFNGNLALGVAGRSLAIAAGTGDPQAGPGQAGPGQLGPGGDELARCRVALAGADEAGIVAARAAAAHLAWRAAAAAVVHTGSRSLLIGEHAQRLAREALFLLVFASRPPIREELSGLLLPG